MCVGIKITSYTALFGASEHGRPHNQRLQWVYKADSNPGDAEVTSDSGLTLAVDGPHDWPTSVGRP